MAEGDIDSGPVVLMGPPGAGKTSVIEAIAMKDRRWVPIWDGALLDPSNLDHWYLARVLAGSDALVFACQIQALTSKYLRARSATADSIMDESVYSTLAYSTTYRELGRLGDAEFTTFRSVYEAYLEMLPPPRLVIHLTAAVDVLLRRVCARSRTWEGQSYDRAYLTALRDGYHQVVQEVSQFVPVLEVETSALSIDDVARRVRRHLADP